MKMTKANWITKFEGDATEGTERLFSDKAIYNMLGDSPGAAFGLLYNVSKFSVGQLVDNAMACSLQSIEIYYDEKSIILKSSFNDPEVVIEFPVVLDKIVNEFKTCFEEGDYFDDPQGKQRRMAKMLRDAADKIEALEVLEP